MTHFRLMAGAFLLCSLPAFAQPELKPVNGLPYSLVSPEEAVRLTQSEKLIALHLRDVTLQDAIKELERQSGLTLILLGAQGTLLKKLSLDLETRSFNEAFQAILDEADTKASLQRSQRSGAWTVVFGQVPTNDDTPKSGIGPFQVHATSISSSSYKSLTLGKTPRRAQGGSLSVYLGFTPNPELSIVTAARVSVDRADDDQGRSIRSEERENFRGLESSWSFEALSVSLSPRPDSKKLARLEGKAIFVLPSKREKWEVADVLSAKNSSHEFQSNGQTIRVAFNGATKIPNGVQVDIDVHYPLARAGAAVGAAVRSPLQSIEQLIRSLTLTDANGQELRAGTRNTSRTAGILSTKAKFTLVPNREAFFKIENGQRVIIPAPEAPVLTGPVNLAFDVPTDLVQTEVPFSFSNLPLP